MCSITWWPFPITSTDPNPVFKVTTFFWSRTITKKRRILKTKLLLHNRKLYLTYGMVLCLVTLTDLQTRHAGLSTSAELLVWLSTQYPIPRSVGVQNTQRWENFAMFDWNRRLSQKRYEIGPWLLWNVNRKLQVADRYVGSDDLEWPLTSVSRSLYTYKSNISGTKLLWNTNRKPLYRL